MSKALTPAQLLAAYKRWGVDVVQVTRGGVSWRDHHRPASTGGWGDMHGCLLHHTGPFATVKGMLAMLWEGRSDLPGPLCNEATGPDGRVYLIGWGRANHAGLGAANVRDALLHDVAPPAPGPDAIDGNAILYGNEVIHPGSGPYPHEQIEAAVRVTAAKIEAHGWKAASAIQHKGWTRRKVDMSWHGDDAQADFRDEVARALRVGPERYEFPKPPAPTPPVPAVVTPTSAVVLVRTAEDPAAYQLDATGTFLQHVTGELATKLRSQGVHVEILTVPKASPLWKIRKV